MMLTLVPCFGAAALDFDNDGLDDVVSIDINSSQKLGWYAQDINDTARRSLGELGEVGDQIAAGNWTGDHTSAKGIISKSATGAYIWDIALPNGDKSISFGSSPTKVVSGLDFDNNGAIDPTIVTVGSKSLEWKILPNPAVSSGTAVLQTSFGGTKALPFFANLDGTGDQIAYATVDKRGLLAIRTKNVTTGKIKQINIPNFKMALTDILPVKGKDGKDLLFVLSRSGTKFVFTIINAKNQAKRVSITADSDSAVIVGDFFDSGSQLVAVRKSSSAFTLIATNGRKTTVGLTVSGILVDDININSFSDVATPNNPVPSPRTPSTIEKVNPVCSGIMNSLDNLLYKPRSDTTGNVVIVFDGVYKREFLTVSIQLKDGAFAQAFWKGLALWGNPDKTGPRQHWRTGIRSSQVANGALIVANDGTQECRYTLPGDAGKRWE